MSGCKPLLNNTDMANIYLFDLDGTILRTGGAGHQTFVEALSELTDRAEEALDFSFSGLTDPIIIRRGLQNAGIDPKPELFDTVRRAYLERLGPNLEHANNFRIFSGAVQMARRLRNHSNFGESLTIGVGTGNFAEGAATKLATADLSDLFDFGGFGSDAHDRADILQAGVAKGANRLDLSPDEAAPVIIGDTPKDVRAGAEIGATTIAVTTGDYSENQLAAENPDEVVRDLEKSTVLQNVI